MHDSERLSVMIGDIYDAALDASLWPSVLGDVAAFVGGPAAALFYKDASSKTGDVYYDNGFLDPKYKALYFERYIQFDPATTRQFFAEIDEPMSTADLMDYDEFTTCRFFQEWAKPQGLVDFVSAVLDKSATSAAMVGVFRHARDGVVDDATRGRMRLLTPHLRRAVCVGRVIEVKSAQAASFADALDGVRVAMVMVHADGRIAHANTAAHAMLAAGDVMTVASGRIVAASADAQQILRDAFLRADEGDNAVGVNAVAVPIVARDGERYVAHVLPLTSGRRHRTGANYAAAAALFVQKATIETKSAPELLGRMYRLTPTELRIMLGIVDVGGVPEVAAALGIAESTVKTHLGRLYEKTGARRHADLVKLLANAASPLL